MSLLTMPLCHLVWEWTHTTLHLMKEDGHLEVEGQGEGSPVKSCLCSTRQHPGEGAQPSRRQGTHGQGLGQMHLEHHPFFSSPQGQHSAIPLGWLCSSRTSKSLSLLCCSPKISSPLGVEEPLFFSLARGKHSTSVIAWKRCQAGVAMFKPQAAYGKCSVREIFPIYLLSICPCFLIHAVGMAFFHDQPLPMAFRAV